MENLNTYLKDFANSNDYYKEIHIGVILITRSEVLKFDGLEKQYEYHQQILNNISSNLVKESIIINLATFDFEKVASIMVDLPQTVNEYQYNEIKKINEIIKNLEGKTKKHYFTIIPDLLYEKERNNLDMLINEVEYKLNNTIYKKR